MQNQTVEFLSKCPPFSELPETDLIKLCDAVSTLRLSKGDLLAKQKETKLDNIFIIKDGGIELYYEKKGEKKLSGFLRANEVYGAISILMNATVSVRTAIAISDTELFVLPRERFLDTCTRHKFIYEHYAENFNRRMQDQPYTSIIAVGQAYHFLSDLEPFSFLPKQALETIANNLSIIHYPKNTLLFTQGISKIEYLYIIQEGAAERFFEESEEKKLRGMLGEGDLYGGISMLLNEGVSVRSLRVTENSYFYILPKEVFLDICKKHESFSEFFTDTFGKRMLDRSYAAIMTQNIRTVKDAPAFFNQTVESIYNPEIVDCDMDLPIQAAASIMSDQNCSSIFVRTADDEYVGVATDNDLRKKVTAKGYDILKPISDIMSTPLQTIPSQALVFEALMEMMQKNIKHLAVVDAKNKVTGVVTNRDLLRAQGQSPFFIVREIAKAKTIPQIVAAHNQMPHLIQSLIQTGAKARNVNRFITTVSDSILEKIIGFALNEMGPPPARFAFMVLGSEGRNEQTLKTDQDNAIIFEDVSDDSLEKTTKYFLKLGDKICTWLDQVGYAFCKGDVMAKNPKWCQPLKKWKNYFTEWIHTAKPEALLQASIFFDFRCAYGERELVHELRQHLNAGLGGWPGFFRHMAENALFFTPPIGFFRNFLVASKGEHRDEFDIKAAMQPIVDFARIYALKNKIHETNTLGRLNQLHIQKVLAKEEYNELETAYSYLMQLRFVGQVQAVIDEKAEPNNYINPKKLSRIEQKMLKEIFTRIEKFQAKLSFDFTGLT
jgi:CBS domain-containing protein